MFVSLGRVLVGLVFAYASRAGAQTGNNAVYNSSGNCSPSSPCASSPAFIDASVFVSKAMTCCGALDLPGTGRYWGTILLPAGTAQLYQTWTLPQYTRIIGEGTGETTLQTCKTTLGCTNNFIASATIPVIF